MSGKRPRSADEIKNSFNNQCDYLFRSCRAFDAGQENEALRLSTTLRVLLHHTPRSNSLLNQMNLLNQLSYVDSGVRREDFTRVINENAPDGFVYNFNPADTGLVISAFIGNELKFIAPLLRNRFRTTDYKFNCIVATRNYSEWWEDKFIEVSNDHVFSRKDIVLALANKEGGAHLDPDIEVSFDDLFQDSLGQSGALNDAELVSVQPNIAYATVRQIAYEIMATFDDNLGTNLIQKTQTNNERQGWFAMPQITLLAR